MTIEELNKPRRIHISVDKETNDNKLKLEGLFSFHLKYLDNYLY